jgi:hypothetical protein
MLCCETDDELLDAPAALPTGAIAYTNPRYKLAQIRAVGGTELQIIHGSSRNIAGSLAAGVNIVVSSPLAALPQPWPTPTLDAVQHIADQLQRTLDAQADHQGRVAIIAELAGATVANSRRAPVVPE